MMIISFICFFVFVFWFSYFYIYIFSIFIVSENDENASDMASGSSYEEVKNAEIPLPCPGILLMFISVGHTSIYERFEVTNGVFRSRNSKKDRQYNSQKKRNKATKQWSMKSVHIKLFTDRTARTTLKTGNESKCSARIQLSCSSIYRKL
jgi:hypothetical protein